MKKVYLMAMVLLLAACAQQAPKVERLHVEGTSLMNEKGDTVELKGMSFGWNVLWPRFYNADAVKHVERTGSLCHRVRRHECRRPGTGRC